MKNILILFAFLFTAGIVTAQEAAAKTCSKTGKVCSKTAAKTCSKTANAATTASLEEVTESEASASNVLSALAEADLAAEGDASIVRKECPTSGNISYYKKSVCDKSGKVSMDEVKYCTKSQAFINSSPSDVMSDGAAKVIKTADTVDGKVQSSATGAKKKCCKGKKACGAKKGA